MRAKMESHYINEVELEKKIKSGEVRPVFIPKKVSFTDIIKYQFCTDIILYAKDKKLRQVDIALMINVNKSEISKLFSYNLKEFSQERILGFIEVLISQGAKFNMEKSWDEIKIQSKKLERRLKTKTPKREIYI